MAHERVLFFSLTCILVVGAALTPHMWVLSCLMLLTLIALLVLHDVRRDRSLQAAYGWSDEFIMSLQSRKSTKG